MLDNLNETISEKYDNEINPYKLITLESIMLNCKVLNNYRNNLVNKYTTITLSVQKTKNKIESALN